MSAGCKCHTVAGTTSDKFLLRCLQGANATQWLAQLANNSFFRVCKGANVAQWLAQQVENSFFGVCKGANAAQWLAQQAKNPVFGACSQVFYKPPASPAWDKGVVYAPLKVRFDVYVGQPELLSVTQVYTLYRVAKRKRKKKKLGRQ